MKNKKFILGSVITGIVLISALAFNAGVFPSILAKTDAHVNLTKKSTKISVPTDENQNGNLIYTSPKQEENYQDMTKEEILLRMINSIDYFQTAKGEFKECTGPGDEVVDVNYEVSNQMKDNHEYNFGSFCKISSLSSVNISYLKNDTIWNINENNGTYNVVPTIPIEKSVPLTLKTAFSVDNKGYNVTAMRERPSISYAFHSLYPYEIASNFTRNLKRWDIESQNAPLLGHNTILIKGNLEHDQVIKQGGATFRFWVDKDSGILLQYELSNNKGDVVQYIHPASLEVNIPVNSNDFTPKLDNLQKEDRFKSFNQGPHIVSGNLDKEIPTDVRAQWEEGLKKSNQTTVFEKAGNWYIIPKTGYCVNVIENGKIHLSKLSAEKSKYSIPAIAYNYGENNLTVVYDD